jgi:hypothetical protein
MAKKLPDLSGTSGLGDLTKILHNQGVSDLSWLAVDEADYRAAEALPKQNLDIIPEFQKALISDTKEGSLNVPQLVPLKPHTIVNRNPLSQDYGQTAPTDQTAPIRNRVAKMVMMGMDNNTIAGRLQSEFGIGDIRRAKDAINEVIAERGLLGNVYINASYFPRACKDPKERQFARAVSRNALFVLGGCDNSSGCDCQKTGICKTFGGKRVVAEVPYTAKVVAHYAPTLASEKRLDGPVPVGRMANGLPASAREYKEILRAAFLKTPIAARAEGVLTVQTQQPVPKAQPTQADYDAFWHRKFSAPVESMPSPGFLKYAARMMKGDADLQVLAASQDPEIAGLVAEYGILGKTYLDMDALEGCNNTLNLMHQLAADGQSNQAGLGIDPRDLHLDYVIRRSATCTHCKGAPDGACAQICKYTKIVSKKQPISKETFLLALQRAALQHRLTTTEVQNANARSASIKSWATAVAYVNLHNPIPPADEQVHQYSGVQATIKTLQPGRAEVAVAQMDPEEVRRTISHLMNTGLSGKPLQAAILQRYSRDDLTQVPEVGRRAAKDDGVQGVFFIDPTAYRDYGKGCNVGSQAFRKRGAPHVLASDGCTGCMLQTAPGWCSKYAKSLIRQVPTQVRQAAVAAKRKLPVVQAAPVENPVETFELANELVVEPPKVRAKGPEITIGGPSLDG